MAFLPAKTTTTVVEVWNNNLLVEMARMSLFLASRPYIAVDTEFPGFIKKTSFTATEETRYDDLKYNVDSTKLIQLGISLCNKDGSWVHTWQFNLSDFHPSDDVHSDVSIELLRKNGIDFDRNKKEGIDRVRLASKMREVFERKYGKEPINWITFHGMYDVAHLLKLLTNNASLPDTLSSFVEVAGSVLGNVYDMKFVAKETGRFDGGRLGLVRLAELVGVDGSYRLCHHQAGHDSLLTALIFGKMTGMFGDMERYKGVLYGLESVKLLRVQETVLQYPNYNPVPVPVPVVVFRNTPCRVHRVFFVPAVNYMPVLRLTCFY